MSSSYVGLQLYDAVKRDVSCRVVQCQMKEMFAISAIICGYFQDVGTMTIPTGVRNQRKEES